MEPPVRIELTTYRLQGGCSTTELQGRRRRSLKEPRDVLLVVRGKQVASWCPVMCVDDADAKLWGESYAGPAIEGT